MPAHLKLKERQPGQGDQGEQDLIDFKAQLLSKEREVELKKRGAALPEEEYSKRLKTGFSTSVALKTPFPQDADDKFEESSPSEEESKQSESGSESEDEEDEDEEDEDDDELELLREYAKIKREREEEQRRKEIEKMQEIKKKQQEEVLTANPLLN